jgi:hypothetical protein
LEQVISIVVSQESLSWVVILYTLYGWFLVIAMRLAPAAWSWMIGWNVDDHMASIYQ